MSRKRTRPILVCSFCRQRKVKCDKGHPCSNCMKYGNANCDYDYEVSSVEIQLERARNKSNLANYLHSDSASGIDQVYSTASNRERISLENLEETSKKLDNLDLIKLRLKGESRLKSVIKDLEVACSRTIDPSLVEAFHQRKLFLQILSKFTTPVSYSADNDHELDLHIYKTKIDGSSGYMTQYYGPLSYAIMLNSDPELRRLKKHTQNKTEELQRITSLPPFSYTNEIESTFLGVDRINTKWESSKYQKRENNSSQFSQTSTYIKLDTASDLIGNACAVLPPVRGIWEHIAIFFRYIYPFIPLLDEQEFRQDIQKIIPDNSREVITPNSLKLTNRLDYIRLGLLLTVIRLSHSIAWGGEDAANGFHHHILAHGAKPLEGKPDAIKIAQTCLSQFNYNSTSHILALQLNVLLKFYAYQGPELGTISNSSDLYTPLPVLIQMAMSLGLHKVPTDAVVGRRAFLGSKIWHFLNKWSREVYSVYGDAVVFCGSKGITINIPSNIEAEVSSMERFVVDIKNKMHQEIEPTIELLRLISEATPKTTRIQIEYLMELALSDCFVDVIPDEEVEEPLLKNTVIIVKQFNKFLVSYYPMMILHHQLYNHFIQCNDAAKASLYLAKLVELIHGRFMPILASILGYTSQAKYKKLVGLMISPVLFLSVQKAFIINASLILKARMASKSMESETGGPTYNLSLLEEAISRSNNFVSSYFNYFSRLTGKLNQGWRYSKLTDSLADSLSEVQALPLEALDDYGFTESNVVTLRNIIEDGLKVGTPKRNPDTGNHVAVNYQDQAGNGVSATIDGMVPRSPMVHENLHVVIDEDSYVTSGAAHEVEADSTVSSDMSFLFHDMDDIFRNYLH